MRLVLLAFVAGCWWLQQQADLPPAQALPPAACVLASVSVALAWSRRKRRLPGLSVFLPMLLAFAAAFCWAAWRAELRMLDWLGPHLEAQDIDVRGVVSGLPAATGAGTRFAFTIESGSHGMRLPHRVVLSWRGAPEDLRPGQRYTLTVRLRRPRGLANPYGFDYAYWLLAQGYGATGYVRELRDGPHEAAAERLAWRVEAMRAALRDRIRAALPPDARYAPILVALVVGDQRGIDADDWRLFNRTGTGHLVAISGLHITMIAGMAATVAGWLWRHSFGLGRRLRRPLPLWRPVRHAALVAAVLVALGYGLVAGMQIPALRTVAMLTVAALAVWSGRAPPASLVLAWAAFVAVLIDPWAVMSPGFWLSFGAVGVIFLAAGHGGAEGEGFLGRLRARLAAAARTQWAVTIGLVPLTLLLFRQVSVISPLANAIAIPVVSLLVTPLALAGAAMPQAVAALLLALAHQVLAWLAAGLRWMASPPWAVWEAAQAGAFVTALAMAGVLVLLAPAPFGLRPRLHGVLLILPMVLARGDGVAHGEFRAVMLDVGQGTAVLLLTRSHALLYDTGPAYVSGASAGAQVVLPYLRGAGVRALDHLMVSHEDIDHAGGVPDVVAAVPVASRSSGAPALHPMLASSGPWEPCSEGQQWEWDGVQFMVLHPAAGHSQNPVIASNARSCVLRVASAHHSLLLTGDIGRAEEHELVLRLPAEALGASVLVVPHHGSGTSSSAEWLEAVAPDAAVFQLGHGNRYRHPRTEVWNRYGRAGILRYRTDETGAVTMTTDGERYVLSAFRQTERRYWRDRPQAPR